MFFLEKSGPFTNLSKANDLRFFYTGTAECDHEGGWESVIRDHYRLHVVLKGRGELRLGDKTDELRVGDVFLICPEVTSTLRPLQKGHWQYLWLAFDGAAAKNYLTRAGLSKDHPIRQVKALIKFENLYREMVKACANQTTGDLDLQASLYQFLALLIKDQPEKTFSTTDKNEVVLKAINWIERNYSRRIKVSELLDLTALDPKYFSRLFRKTTGLSPQLYLINFRLKRAQELLRDSSLSIAAVAHSVGYEDALLFSKIFKKFIGKAPTAIREELLLQ